MPLLGRLFAKRNKIPPPPRILDDDSPHSPTFAHTTESNDSTTSSYVTPDISVPSHPNATNLLHLARVRDHPSTASHSSSVASGSGGALRLFRRKKSSTISAELSSGLNSRTEFDTPQRTVPPRPSEPSTDPTDLRRLRPPPSRSAIFAAYADPGSSLSTRSLPENTSKSSSPLLSPPPSPSPPQKRPSLFSWAKPSSHSSSNTGSNIDSSLTAQSDSSDLPPDWHSFNLKSFRHVGSATPPPNQNSAPPIPRPRGLSLHSDSSQRISVGVFREAQARRSQTGSPVPSPIDSSPTLSPSIAATNPGPRPGHGGPRPSRSSAALLQSSRQKRSSFSMVSTTDENLSSENDSDGESVYKGKSRQRPGRKAQSEHGHGSMVTESSFKRATALVQTQRPTRSHLGHATPHAGSRPVTQFEENSKKPELPRRSLSSLSLYENPNTLAHASTTSLNTSTAGQKRNPSMSSNLTRSTGKKKCFAE